MATQWTAHHGLLLLVVETIRLPWRFDRFRPPGSGGTASPGGLPRGPLPRPVSCSGRVPGFLQVRVEEEPRMIAAVESSISRAQCIWRDMLLGLPPVYARKAELLLLGPRRRDEVADAEPLGPDPVPAFSLAEGFQVGELHGIRTDFLGYISRCPGSRRRRGFVFPASTACIAPW